jgi:hypothetical protein
MSPRRHFARGRWTREIAWHWFYERQRTGKWIDGKWVEGEWIGGDKDQELTEEEQRRLSRSMAWHPSRGPQPEDRG